MLFKIVNGSTNKESTTITHIRIWRAMQINIVGKLVGVV